MYLKWSTKTSFPPFPLVSFCENAGTENGASSATGGSSAMMRTTGSVPDMSSIVSEGGELYGSMMVGSLPAMGGGLGQSAPPSPELGPVSAAGS